MGSAVDKKNLGTLLETYADAGIGGVEIAPIYGAMDYEERYIEFLSPQWLNMLEYTAQKADSLGMGVDMTQGTGWPFGGPQVTPEYAASKLIIQIYELKGGELLSEQIIVNNPKQIALNPTLQAIMAYGENGEVLDITDKVDEGGILNWRPEAGDWEIYAAFAGKTGQKVKRAAPGGVGYTLNHFSEVAVEEYLKRFENAFKDKNYGVRAFYNDSYEVYGADWSPGFFEAFETRRGYDLRPHLRELVSKEESDTVARLKADYRFTLSEMLLENFTQSWTDWAHEHGSITKNQAHGSPGNLLDLYAAVDIPECETFGSSYFPIPGLRRDSADIRNVDPDPVMLKFASSGAHASGNNLVSSETFTWLGEHFKTSFSQCKPEVEQVFLSGVNHVFYHGVTYSPEDVAWPGWLFYASLNLTPANSLWPHFKGLNDYIARCQSILQSGRADNELAIYWPAHDVWSNPKGMEMLIKVHDIDDWLHPTQFYQQAKSLMETGYSVDFVSDKMLEEAAIENGSLKISSDAVPHKVLIVPATKFMPIQTLQNILILANEGATVVMEKFPEDVPGYHNLESRRATLKNLLKSLVNSDDTGGIKTYKTGAGKIILAENVQKALEQNGIVRETLTDAGLKFIRRISGNGKYYYLVNHTAKDINTTIPVNMEANSVVILDPQSGDSGTATISPMKNQTAVKIQIKAGEALILQASDQQSSELSAWKYIENKSAPIDIKGKWTLRFTEGGPEIPSTQKLDKLVSWSGLSEQAEAFSGTGEYTISFDLSQKTADEYILDLGKVSESARVWINGEEVGILWSLPYQARVGKYLKPGQNTLKIEVANLMANRIRYMDRQGIEWRRYHEINFVNINYEPFDASNWEPMTSGLLGPVRLLPYQVSR